MNIEKIYHLADIHIRNLKRHDEYKLVLQKFLNNVDRDNIDNSIIYLGGDIVHAKTEMSPELLREVSWFLNECAKRKHTFIITGNHDCNLNNDYRLDALSPIIKNLDNDRIHYLKDTGVYNFENITFVVYSILDKKENWPSADSIQGENKICLFHGPVNLAETDIGYTVSSKSFTADMFDGFDMALLGDIHKRQTIQPYQTHPMKKPIVQYCGSIVQQNHGESLDKHGYLLWDVKSRTYQEFDIENDYGFYTLDIHKGVVPDVKDIPAKPRLRVRISKTEPTQIKRVLTEIKKKYNVQEFTVSKMDTLSKTKICNYDDKLDIGNVQDVEFQNKLIKDYLQRHYLLDDDTLDKVQQVNRDTNKELVNDDMTSNIQWVPKTFEFSNMFSYGENNKIRFDNASGMMGIFAPNTAGKSSLFDIMSFCIFDKTSRTGLAKNILNNRKSNFYCKLNFQIDNVDYYIERVAKLINKGNNVKADVSFWREEDGKITSLNGEQRRDTNNIIQQYLGTYDDFILTTLSLQGNNSLFIDKSQTERKEILSQFMGINIFDKLYNIAHEQNKDNASLIRRFKQDDFTQKLADIQVDLKSKESEYKLLDIQLTGYKNEVDFYNKELISLNKQIVDVKSDKYSLDDLEKDKAELEKSIDELSKTRIEFENKISSLKTEQVNIQNKIDTFDEEFINKNLQVLTQSENNINKVETELEKLSIKLNSLQERKAHLDSHKYNENCEICMENSKSILEQKDEIAIKILGVEREINDNLDAKESYQKTISEYIVYRATKDTLTKLIQDENVVSKDIDKLTNKLSNLETREVKSNNEFKITSKLISDYLDNEKQIKKNDDIRLKIDEVDDNLTESKNNVNTLSKKVLKLNGEISSLKSQKESIEEKIKEVEQLEEQSNLYEYYLNALGKEGVSYELISKALPMIEGEVNNILGQIVDFGFQLEMDGKNITANIVYDNQKWILEMCSGMERFITGLAIRIALINVCNLPRANFLVIDEGFGTLDNENLTSLYMLFAYLKNQFDFVMIISHIDSMRDVVDSLMEIKKVNGYSSIKF